MSLTITDQSKWAARMSVVKITVGLLLVAALLIGLQRFIEYGHSPHYQPLRSITFNLVTIMPFVIMVWLGHQWSLKISHRSGVTWWAYLFLSGMLSVCVYALLICPILFLLGFSSSPVNPAFIEKYLTGTAALHISVYWLVLIVRRQPDHAQESVQRIKVMSGSAHILIRPSDIIWIESADHYLEIATATQTYLHRCSMADMARKLPPGFIRIHRRYIVQLAMVDQVVKKGRMMALRLGDKTLPVSRSRQETVMDLY